MIDAQAEQREGQPDFGPGRRVLGSGQLYIDTYPGRGRRPSTSVTIGPGGEVNRASVRTAFRQSRPRRRPIRLPRSHGRTVPWATRGDRGWEMVGRGPAGTDAVMVHSALARMRARRAGLAPTGWLDEISRREAERSTLTAALTKASAEVARRLAFITEALEKLISRRDHSPDGQRAALCSTFTPTRGPSRRPTAGHRPVGE
jgi:hypothetical protein